MELGGNNRRSSEVQGPRPSPLKIKKESHKMMKKPIIIYTVSPKIIHTTPADFMNLVQRLTGSNSSISNILNNDDDGIGAPIQKPTSPHHHHQPPNAQEQEQEELLADIMGPTTTTSMLETT
ncbi:Protein MKS1 [Senna tora]|uniref:Protein MKS1 n=1 Tax=Senna tora TaxID=362788 RepID=A0A834TXP9_9FABA|nr:Protein MKS1 [Senna tora]